jgi:hypothetical protein
LRFQLTGLTIGRTWRCGPSGRYYRLMPDTPEENAAVSRTPITVQSSWTRWLTPLALLVAVVAVGLAVWALTTASSKASVTSQPGDPKLRACTAFDTVSKAVSTQTHIDLGQEPIAQSAVAGNARLALVGGGQYLLNRLGPDTPKDLADAIRSFANDLQEIGVYALAGVPNTDPDQSTRLAQGDLARKQIVDMCK